MISRVGNFGVCLIRGDLNQSKIKNNTVEKYGFIQKLKNLVHQYFFMNFLVFSERSKQFFGHSRFTQITPVIFWYNNCSLPQL